MPIQDLPKKVYITYSNQDPTDPVLNYGNELDDGEDSILDSIINDMNNADATGVYELVRFITKGPPTDPSPQEQLNLPVEDDGA